MVQNPFPESRRSFAEGLHILIAYLKLQNFTLVGYASLACVPTWHEDFRKDLDRVDVPTLVIRGDEDRIVPITAAGARTAKMIKGARLHVVKGGPHCITWTHAEEVNAELLSFLGDTAINAESAT